MINTFGLGGTATNMLLNRFGLGGFDITIEIVPTPSPPSGGGSSVHRPGEFAKYKTIRITVRYRGRIWNTERRVREGFSNIIFIITSFISKTISTIKMKFNQARATFNQFRIKR